jgi:hypothetical protein
MQEVAFSRSMMRIASGIIEVMLALISLPIGFLFLYFSVIPLFTIFLSSPYGIPYWIYPQLLVGLNALAVFGTGIPGAIAIFRKESLKLALIEPIIVIAWSISLIWNCNAIQGVNLPGPTSCYIFAGLMTSWAILGFIFLVVSKRDFSNTCARVS